MGSQRTFEKFLNSVLIFGSKYTQKPRAMQIYLQIAGEVPRICRYLVHFPEIEDEALGSEHTPT
jgi:hypothetical protein